MSDWIQISIQEFDAIAQEDDPLEMLVGRIILDRLPYAFDTKHQYFKWRHSLAQGLQVDARDVIIVGSAATGRSLSSRKRFGTFKSRSDVDIAVVSSSHFDTAWSWFRRTDPNLISGLDDEGRERFDQHKKHYIFEGVIATDYFLSYLPFGVEWTRELQRSGVDLPDLLKGRKCRIRLYKDSESLRMSQMEALRQFRIYMAAKSAA